MKYPDGQEVRLGDRVKLGHDDGGVVVASIDTNEYTSEHSEAQWGLPEEGRNDRVPETRADPLRRTGAGPPAYRTSTRLNGPVAPTRLLRAILCLQSL